MENFTFKRLTWICLILIVYCLSGCKDDQKPVVNSSPVIDLLQPVIETYPNNQFTIEANITDEAGIKSIQLSNSEWLMNKTIVFEDNKKAYDLKYKFNVPANEVVDSKHFVKIVVTNIGDKVTEITAPVNLTLDVIKPTMVISKPTDQSSYFINTQSGAAEFKIEVALSDDKGLASLTVKSAGLGLDDTVTLSGLTGNYVKDIDFNTKGSYEIVFTVSDAKGNLTTTSRTIKLIDALQFDKMYLTDVFTAQELTSDLFGVPKLMTPSTVPAETGYVFTTKFYSKAAGTEIKFIPQETALAPFVFGQSKDVGNALSSDNLATAVILPAKSYYEIKIDLRTMQYTLTPYVPTDALRSNMYMAGTGFDGQNWNPAVATPLTVNSANPYEFTLETNLSATVQWIYIHSQSWNLPFWRFDKAIPTKVVPSIAADGGGTNVNIVLSTSAVYVITFDYHLNYSKAVKK
jgi:hypothetical protein